VGPQRASGACQARRGDTHRSATGAHVHGITLSAKQREVALDRARIRAIADRVRIDVAHIGEVELEPESLDAIVFSGSIVHMHDRAGIHRWVARHLKPGGRLFISDCYFPAEQRGSRESDATDYILGRALLRYLQALPVDQPAIQLGLRELHVLLGPPSAPHERVLRYWNLVDITAAFRQRHDFAATLDRRARTITFTRRFHVPEEA